MLIRYFIQTWPKRLVRFIRHIFFLYNGYEETLSLRVKKWIPGLILTCLDLFGIPEIYQFLISLKPSVRKLNESEIKLGRSVFEDSLSWSGIYVDEHAILGPKQYRFAYVSFFTINSYGPIPSHVFIHELMHIWQYQKYGSLYIVNALFAQHSQAKYNYGGLDELVKRKRKQQKLNSFNFEQQADIVEDYFLIRRGRRPQWGSAEQKDLLYYEYFLNQLTINN